VGCPADGKLLSSSLGRGVGDAMRTVVWRILGSPAGLTLTILAILTIAATGAYMALEEWDFLTALVFTLATITTIGYGNVYPTHRSAEVFTAALMVFALAAVAVALSTYAGRLIKLVAKGANPMEENDRAVAALRDHIVVAAESDLAAILIEDLRSRATAFVAVTPDEDLHARWVEDGVLAVLGSPDDEETLRRAGIERAAGLIVALASDADNVFVTLGAHDLNPRIRVAARAHTAAAVPKLRRSGANEVLVAEEVMAVNLVSLFKENLRVDEGVARAVEELREALRLDRAAGGPGERRAASVLFRAVRLALQNLGPGMERTLYELGRQFGREAVAPNMSDGSLCEALKDIPTIWSSAGLGELKVDNCEGNNATLREYDCATCQGLPTVGRAVCHLERGVLTGALEGRLGRSVSTTETKCWGLGDSACQFEIAVDADTH